MNNPNVGVFGWIRDGVRRAVLLGFSDAVEQVGTIDEKETLSPQLQGMLREAPRRLLDENRSAAEPLASRGDRKRLGRSLGQLHGGSSAPQAE